jgi:ribosomal protein S18 acetylase RimI-like enzyme
MAITFSLAIKNDAGQFQEVADDVFDAELSVASLRLFLDDQNHHMVIVKDGATIIGFVSAVSYVHPDKPWELWINEVGVAPDWRGQGIAKCLLSMMLEHGRSIGCVEAWVLTEPENAPANALYRSVARKKDAGPTTAIMYSFKLV